MTKTDDRLLGWGRYPRLPQRATALTWADDALPAGTDWLPRGLGRSYGDSCLAPAGGLQLHMTGLDRLIAFDPATGLLRCEAGLSLSDILAFAVPMGWFLPVTPGTRFVTVGGAIANDVHGKNHHVQGSFGDCVRRFALRRSDGRVLTCSPTENADWFAATVGGLGLTGVILWAEIALRRVASPVMDQETVRFGCLDDFFALAAESEADFEYTVSWVDCLARGKSLGRGLFMRANHGPAFGAERRRPARRLSVPVSPPVSPLNRLTLSLFNWAYYRRPVPRRAAVHYQPFFYPLDAIGGWNRLYGRDGFVQWQCVTPAEAGPEPVREMLDRIARSGQGSFLAVLKTFGSRKAPGLLSFPRPGTTLALDFPMKGRATLDLLTALDGVVRACGGAVYPAKDARMGAADFQAFYPQWRQLEGFRDPAIRSAFWQRVTEA